MLDGIKMKDLYLKAILNGRTFVDPVKNEELGFIICSQTQGEYIVYGTAN